MAEPATVWVDPSEVPGSAGAAGRGETFPDIGAAVTGIGTPPGLPPVPESVKGAAREKREADERAVGEFGLARRYTEYARRILAAEGAGLNDVQPWNADQERRKYETDPIQSFGSIGSVFATIASAFTRTPMVNALNGSAAAMQAIKDGNEKEYERAYRAWKDNQELVIKRQQMMHQVYSDAITLAQTDMTRAETQIRANAIKFGDQMTIAMMDKGMWPEWMQAVEKREQAVKMMHDNDVAARERANKDMDLGLRINRAMEGLPPAIQQQVKALHDQGKSPQEIVNVLPPEYKQKMIQVFQEWQRAWQPRPLFENASDLRAQGIREIQKTNPGMSIAEATQKYDAESHRTMSADSLRSLAVRILRGDKSAATGLGYGSAGAANRAALMEMVTQIGKERGLTPDQIGNATSIANIAFQAESRGASSLGQREANLVSAITRAESVVGRVRETSDKVNRTSYPDINRIIIAGREKSGDENVVRYGVALETMINTYASAMGSGSSVLTDNAREHARAILQSNWSKGQIKAALDQMQKELQSELEGTRKAQKEFLEGFEHTVGGITNPNAGKVRTKTIDGKTYFEYGGTWHDAPPGD